MKNNNYFYRVSLITDYDGNDYEKVCAYNQSFIFDDFYNALDCFHSYHIGQAIDDDYTILSIELELIFSFCKVGDYDYIISQ